MDSGQETAGRDIRTPYTRGTVGTRKRESAHGGSKGKEALEKTPRFPHALQPKKTQGKKGMKGLKQRSQGWREGPVSKRLTVLA